MKSTSKISKKTTTKVTKKPAKKTTTSSTAKAENSRPSEAEAATAIARAWLSKGGFHEDPSGESPERIELLDTSFDDEGAYYVDVRVYVPNLDVELVTTGEHPDGITVRTP